MENKGVMHNSTLKHWITIAMTLLLGFFLNNMTWSEGSLAQTHLESMDCARREYCLLFLDHCSMHHIYTNILTSNKAWITFCQSIITSLYNVDAYLHHSNHIYKIILHENRFQTLHCEIGRGPRWGLGAHVVYQRDCTNLPPALRQRWLTRVVITLWFMNDFCGKSLRLPAS